MTAAAAMVRGAIADLSALGDQLGDLGEMKDEVRKVKREAETWTNNVKMAQQQLDETEAAQKHLARQYRERHKADITAVSIHVRFWG